MILSAENLSYSYGAVFYLKTLALMLKKAINMVLSVLMVPAKVPC